VAVQPSLSGAELAVLRRVSDGAITGVSRIAADISLSAFWALWAVRRLEQRGLVRVTRTNGLGSPLTVEPLAVLGEA
jgi:hypothetical protein